MNRASFLLFMVNSSTNDRLTNAPLPPLANDNSIPNLNMYVINCFEERYICIFSHLATSWWRAYSLQWRYNERDGVSNYQPHDCLFNRLFRRRWKKTSKLRVTGLCAGNSPMTGEFPAQKASNAENVSIWWRHHVETPRRRRQGPVQVYPALQWLLLTKATQRAKAKATMVLTYF